MTISTPDTFTMYTAEQYILSIRLRPGGLSFSAYNPSVRESFFYRDADFDRSIPYVSALKDFFFDNECLAWTYRRSYVICVSPQYTLTPDALMDDKRKAQILAFNFSAPEKRCLSNHLTDEQATVVFGVNEEVYEFCSRSLTRPIFNHHQTPQLTMLKRQSRSGSRQMFAILHPRMVDICCFADKKLLFVNTFDFGQLNDLLYYILCVWKLTEMNQLDDSLLLAGDKTLCMRLTDSLHQYVRNIGRIEIPDKAYLLGGEILQAPVDMILSSVCES
jgi:hypothetical protein